MQARTKRILRWLLVGFVTAFLAVVLGVIPIGLGLWRSDIERIVLDATGLELSAAGPIVVRLGPRASLRASEISVATPGGHPLVELDTVSVKVSLLALLSDRIHVRNASINGARLRCASLPEREPRDAGERPDLPAIGVDGIEISSLVIRCGPRDIVVDRFSAATPFDKPVSAEGTGSLAGNSLEFRATGGQLGDALQGSEFAFESRLELANEALDVKGTVKGLLSAPEIHADYALSVADPVAVATAFDFALPSIGHTSVRGKIEAAFGDDIRPISFTAHEGAVGQTQFTASGSVVPGARPRVNVEALVERLDLAPFLEDRSSNGAPPGQADANLGPVLALLDRLDAEVRFSIEQVSGLPIQFEKAAVEAELEAGQLSLEMADAVVAGASVMASSRLDSRAECPLLELDVAVRNFDLDVLEAKDPPATGRINNVRAELSSCGERLSQYVDGLAGSISSSGATVVHNSGLAATVDHFVLALDPGKPTRASLRASVAGEPAQVDLVLGSLNEMLGESTWPVGLNAKVAGGDLEITGRAGFRSEELIFDVETKLGAPAMGAFHRWLPVRPGATLPLRATSTLTLDRERFLVENIALTLGASDIEGSLAWEHAQIPDTLDFQLRSGFVDLEEIDGMLPEPSPNPASDDGIESAAELPPLPPVDIDIAFDRIRGGALDLEQLELRGSMRAGLINNARASVIVEDELKLSGELDLDFRQVPAKAVFDGSASDADFGRLLRRLELIDDLDMLADGLTVHIAAKGENPREFLTTAVIDADVAGFAWDVQGRKEIRRVRLDKLELRAGPNYPTGIASEGSIDELPVILHIRAPSIVTLLGSDPELPLRIAAAAGSDLALAEIRVDRSAGDGLRARVEASGERFDDDVPDLVQTEAPLADWSLTGSLEMTESSFSLPDLEARLGSSVVNGSVQVTGGDRERLAVTLTSDFIQADDLLYLAPNVNSGSVDPPVIEESKVDSAESAEEEVVTPTRGPLILANDLVAKYQEQYDLDVRIAVNELRAGSRLVGSTELALFIDETEFRIDPLAIRFPGGSIDAAYKWHIDEDNVHAELVARADNAAYGGLLRLADPASEAQGLIYLDVDLRADTEWSDEKSEFELLLRNADGTLDVAVWPANLEAGVLDLWTANLVLALLPTPTSENPSRLNCVVARFEAKDGLLKPRVALMDSTGQIIRGRGSIDLSHGELDLLMTPQAKREKFLSASTPVKVTGPLRDFEVGVESGGFIGMLLKWYTSLIYVPFKWLTGERFPPDGTATCFDAMDWDLTPELEEYYLERDFSSPPPSGL